MATRSRTNRESIPGYDEHPSHEDRQRQHRQVRHAAHRLLATVDDLEDVSFPEVRRTRAHEVPEVPAEIERRRFRVWKTKFWKRRDSYREMRESLDAKWEEVTAEPEEEW